MSFARRFYDLSQPVFTDCPQWAKYEPVSITRPFTTAMNGYNAEKVVLMTHAGTHVDAPAHFFDEAPAIEAMPLDAFAGTAMFVDMRRKRKSEPIGAADLAPIADRIAPGDVVLLNTGWGHKRAVTREYLTEWPWLDGTGAELLVARGVKGVGIDALSLGGWGDDEKGRPCHRTLLGAGRFIVEDLRVPDEVMDGKKRPFCAFPILLRGCGGAWARAVAWDAA